MHNIYHMVKQKKMIMVILALAVSTMIYSGIVTAQGTATSKISANSSASTYGEEVTFTATVVDLAIDGTSPSGTVTFKDGTQDLMTATLSVAEPMIKTATTRFSPPSGTLISCNAGPTGYDPVYCPIIQWGDYTYWAYSYADNRNAMDIVAHDASGNIVQQWEKEGARYLWQITMDAAAQTITFWGQDNVTTTMGWGEFLSPSASGNFTASDLAIGSHAITAAFSGDNNHAASESPVMSYTVHPTYTVTYNGNGSTGGSVPTNSNSYSGNKVSIYGNNGNLVKTGYTFTGWNTQADGQGTYYAAGAEGTISFDVTLYAKWTKTLDVGTGTVSDPYQITTGEELDTVRNYLNSGLYFKLMADIDLSSYGQGWLPIGGLSTPFQGNMDGNGHKITGLTINRPNDRYVGLFGYTSFNTSVTNMKLVNVNVTGKQEVGGLIGYNYGTISNSFATGNVTASGSKVGGLIGYNYISGTISNSFATGNVTGSGSEVGGLIGYNYGTISNSFATGNVTGNGSKVGGLIGNNNGGTISYSYAAGNVTGSSGDVGGLIGYQNNGTISNSFYDSGTTGQSDTGKGVGHTTTEMKMQSTYADSSWNFTSIWGISSSRNNGYPYLQAIQKFVTYDGNGNTDGSAPIDSKSYSQGVTVNVYSNKVTLVKTHYTFAGWNTQADGNGTDYAAGASFNMGSSDVTLYAKWTLNPTYTVTYNGNGSTGGSVPTDSGSYEQGVTVLVNGNSGNLEKTGYTFAGWNTAVDGSGMSYTAEANFAIGAHNVTLYAQWISANALLSGLSVDQGTLTPAFLTSQTNYTVSVANTVSSLHIFVAKGDPNQTLTVTGATYSSVTGNVYDYNASNLITGANPITIQVTAQIGNTNSYTVTVNRAQAPSSGGGSDVISTLGIGFNPSSYSVQVGSTVSTIVYASNSDGTTPMLTSGVTYVSENPSMATVNSTTGVVTGIAAGSAVIKAAYQNQTATASVIITGVTPTPLTASSTPIQITNQPVTITVPSNVTDAKIAVTPLTVGSNKQAVLPFVGVQAATSLGNVSVVIPAGTTITAPANWNGTINLPQVQSNSSVSVSNANVSAVIEVGVPNVRLTFDKAVRLLIPNQGGKSAGYVQNGVFTPITGTITADTQEVADSQIAAGGEAIITVGNDLVIWTKHFTQFVSYTSVTPVTRSSSGGGSTATNSGTILAASGGTLILNGAKIDVPAGATDSNIQVTVDKVSDTSILPEDNALQLISDVYEFKKDVNGDFSKPVVITLPFDKTKVDFTKSSVGVYWLNEQAHMWVQLDNLQVDQTAGMVSGSVTHFTKFAVLAADKVENVPPQAAQPQSNEVSFTDIKGHWAETSVRYLVKLGAINGYSDNTFKPDNNITRAEFVTVIVKAFHLTAQDGKSFADASNHWAKSAIATAATLGVVTGYSESTFGPDDLITREQMAVIVIRAAQIKAADKSISFTDSADISDWARSALAAASADGLINGYEGGTVKPKANTTRAEAVTVILRTLQLKK